MAGETPNFLKPRLRLFLSADIVGSTALKQSRFGALADPSTKGPASWFAVIQGFYIESRQAFLGEWSRLQAETSAPKEYFGDAPAVWKTIGDEVLFVKVLTDFRQLSVTLKCWDEAVATMRDFVKREDSRLDIKCTAWVAGFPFKNKEVVLGGEANFDGEVVDNYFLESGKLLNSYYDDPSKSNVVVDYIGPSIDIGFRLASLSTARKFIVSVDVAYILSLATPSSEKVAKNIPLFYEGTVPLKGVFGGTRYPVFWIDMGEGKLPGLEDALTGQKPCSRGNVFDYCQEFYAAYSAYTFRPFIQSSSEKQLDEKPPWYDEIHGNLVKNFLDSTTSEEAVIEPTDVEDPVDAAEIVNAIQQFAQEIGKFNVKGKRRPK